MQVQGELIELQVQSKQYWSNNNFMVWSRGQSGMHAYINVLENKS